MVRLSRLSDRSAKPEVAHWLYLEELWAFLAIVTVALLAYGLFYAPALYSDDWTHIVGQIDAGHYKWFDPHLRRPLQNGPLFVQNQLLGLNIPAYYLLLGSLHILLALLLYRIANLFAFLRTYQVSLVVALLFLVYPANYTHMWLTMLHIYCALGLTLLYGYALAHFADSGRAVTLVFALLCLLISVPMYEAQIGLACFWALLLVLIRWKMPLWRRLLVLTPIPLASVFMVWRTIGYQLAGVKDTYLDQVTLSPTVLFERLLLGYKISLGWSWSTAVQELVPWQVDNKVALLLLGGLVVALWGVAGQIAVWRTRQESHDTVIAEPWGDRWPLIRKYLLLAVVGFVMIGAGYLPVIIGFLPTLGNIASRFNLFAAVGAGVVVAALLMVGSLLFARRPRHVPLLFLLSASLVVALGIVTHAQVQADTRTAWREQQQIWHALFAQAPNFEDETLVLLILPGYQDRVGYQNWRRTPLYAYWEVSRAVQLFYVNNTLRADLIYPDIDANAEGRLTVAGVVNRDTGEVTPYTQVAAFRYDPAAATMHQLEALPVELVEGATQPIPLAVGRVYNEGVEAAPLRRLVE